MKILALAKDIKNPTVYSQGYALYKQALESIGYTVDITSRDTGRTFTQFPFNNIAIGSGIGIKPEEILAEGTGHRLNILTYSTPVGTNPAQYGYNLNGTTPISMPESWYGTSPETLCLYLLHETAHAAQMFAGVSDTVHTVPAQYGSMVNGNQIYYLDLLKQYKNALDQDTVNTTAKQRTLKIGSIGSDVVALQKKLREKGFFTYPINTGYFGSVTRTAVITFQKSVGLTPDGVVGPVTLKALK